MRLTTWHLLDLCLRAIREGSNPGVYALVKVTRPEHPAKEAAKYHLL